MLIVVDRSDPFWGRVAIRENKEKCWEWLGAPVSRGYGAWGSSRKRAHRVAYEKSIGQIPEGLCVLHKCDNKMCVNPHHLFVGDHKDNNWDCARKGRAPHKIDAKDAKEIIRARESGEKVCDLARKYNVSHAIISLVSRGKRKCWL